jgi:hypothetical protein
VEGIQESYSDTIYLFIFKKIPFSVLNAYLLNSTRRSVRGYPLPERLVNAHRLQRAARTKPGDLESKALSKVYTTCII